MAKNHEHLARIGRRIYMERIARQIKQETLGKKVNLSKSEISRIENGKREIKLSTLIQIAKAIGISPATLLDNEILNE